MGYTHYWFERPTVIVNYDAVCKDIDKIHDYCKEQGITLLGWNSTLNRYTAEAPLYDADEIAISAPEDEVCESFCMTRIATDTDEYFLFCKTARLPYDLAVCLILLRMQAICSGFQFDSDGDFDTEPEWTRAKAAYAEIFG